MILLGHQGIEDGEMQRNARKAYNAIKSLSTEHVHDVHLIDHGGENPYGAHFQIGCEPRTTGDEPVGDYYQEHIREYVDDDGVIQNAFGIRTVINDILDRNDLYAEWINGAVIGVYDLR